MKPVSDAVKEKIESSIFNRKELMMFKQELKAECPDRKINQSDLHRKLCRSAWKAFRESFCVIWNNVSTNPFLHVTYCPEPGLEVYSVLGSVSDLFMNIHISQPER